MPLHSGLVMIPITLAVTVSKRWITRFVKRYGYETFLLVNTMLVGASIVGFAAFSPSFPLIGELAILTAPATEQRYAEGLVEQGRGQRQQSVLDGADARHRPGRVDRGIARAGLRRPTRFGAARLQAEFRLHGRLHTAFGRWFSAVSIRSRATRVCLRRAA